LRAGLATELITAFVDEEELFAGAAEVGDPVAVLPVLFHLLWRGRLIADLTGSLLGEHTRVVAAPA
jgi:hypothetical protein